MRTPASQIRLATLLGMVGGVVLSFFSMLAGDAFGQSSGGFYEYPQTALSGIVRVQANVPQDRCRRLCETRSGCAGFDHASDDSTCRLFASVGRARQSPLHTAATRDLITNYRPPSNPPSVAIPEAPPPQEPPETEDIAEAPPPPPATFRRFRNRDLTRAASESYGAQTVDICETMCRNSGSWCVSFTFDDWNRRCFLKAGSGQLLINARAITGVRTDLAPPPLSGAVVYFERFNDRAFPGRGYEVVSAGNRESCERTCSNANGCIAYSFASSSRKCTLYEQVGEYSGRRGVFSGSKRQE